MTKGKNIYFATGIVCLVSFVWFSLHLWAFWPGIMSNDAFFALKAVAGNSSPSSCNISWESYFYDCLFRWSLAETKSFVPVLFLQIAVASSVVAYGFYVIARHLKSFSAGIVWAFLMVLLPVNRGMVIFTERDIIYTWVFLLVLLQVVHLLYTRQEKFFLKTAAILFSCGLAASFRREAIFWLPTIFVGMIFLAEQKKKVVPCLLIFAISVTGFFYFGFPALIGASGAVRVGDRYNIHAYVSPFFEILNSPNPNISEEQKQFFKQFIDEEKLRKNNADTLEMGAIKDMDIEAFSKFHGMAIQVIIANPQIFYQNRLRAFLRAMNPTGGHSFYYNKLDDIKFVEANREFQDFGIVKNWHASKIYSHFNPALFEQTNSWNWLLWSPIAGVILSLLTLLLGFLDRRWIFIAVLPAMLSVVIILTVPFPKPKYFYFANLYAPLALVLLFINLKQSAWWIIRQAKIKNYLLNIFEGSVTKVSKSTQVLEQNLQEHWKNKFSAKGLSQNVLGAVAKILVSLICLWVLLGSMTEFTQRFSMQQNSNSVWLILLGFQFIMLCISNWKWYLLQKINSPPVGWFKLLRVSWAAQSVGLFGLGVVGSDFLRGYFLEKVENNSRQNMLKSIVLDRGSSFFGLCFVAIWSLLFVKYGDLSFIFLLIPFMFSQQTKNILVLGILGQFIKVFIIIFLLKNASFPIENIAELVVAATIGLGIEILPLSLDGLGLGHLSFYHLFASETAVSVYHAYFLSKIFFKLIGLIFVRSSVSPAEAEVSESEDLV